MRFSFVGLLPYVLAQPEAVKSMLLYIEVSIRFLTPVFSLTHTHPSYTVKRPFASSFFFPIPRPFAITNQTNNKAMHVSEAVSDGCVKTRKERVMRVSKALKDFRVRECSVQDKKSGKSLEIQSQIQSGNLLQLQKDPEWTL